MRIRWVVAEDPWARSNGMHRRLHYQFPPGYFFLPTSSSLDLPIVKGYEWRRRHQWQEHHKRRALAASTQPKKWEPWWPYSVLFRKVEKAELSRDALSHYKYSSKWSHPPERPVSLYNLTRRSIQTCLIHTNIHNPIIEPCNNAWRP